MPVHTAARHATWALKAIRLAIIVFFSLQCRRDRTTTPVISAAEPLAPPARVDPASYAFVLRAMALELGDVDAGFIQALSPTAATLGNGAIGTHHFDALPGHCYRIYATGGIDLERLTVTVIAADGLTEVAQGEATHALAIGVTRPLCPPAGGSYEIRVRADRTGDYAIAVYATP